MPVSALPSRIGAGELGESAFQFIELLKENHVKISVSYTHLDVYKRQVGN